MFYTDGRYEAEYKARRDIIESALKELAFDDAQRPDDIPSLLAESMRYSLLAGGKRFRGVLTLSASAMFSDGNAECEAAALPYACALEMIHTYSLIHDDLPCMDDDDLRRGIKTNHIVYGEGQAMLAGDGLLSFAFSHMLLAAARSNNSERDISAMLAVAEGAGVYGMVVGQCVDLLYENDANRPSKEIALRYVQEKKTAAMIIGALKAGAYIAGADADGIEAVGLYGQKIGVAFQIVDDILDLEGDEGLLGKPINSDVKSGKLTHPSLYGIEKAKADVSVLQEEAIAAIRNVKNSEFLIELVKRQTMRVS